jgi:AraC-like DNA-binding protein/CheY-like chemotaxis protein
MFAENIFVVSNREDFELYRFLSRLGQGVEYHLFDFDECNEHILRRAPGLVLIDCGLETQKGFTLLSEIKSNRPHIMVILIASNSSEDTAVRAFRLGAREYFRKPFEFSELQRAIENLRNVNVRNCTAERRVHLSTINMDGNGTSNMTTSYDVPVPANLLRAINYIDRNLWQPLSIDRIAGEAGVSRYHFCRVFKKFFGLSPICYLTRKRVEKAKGLLRRNTPISTVSQQCGFNDLSNFYRQFRRITGQSPSSFRNNLSGE